MEKETIIVLAEKDAYIADTYKLLFEEKGIGVRLAQGLEKIFRVAKEVEAPLVIIGHDPQNDLDALELLRLLPQELPETKVYIMTNTASPDLVQECYKKGASGFFIRTHSSTDQLLKDILLLLQ